MTAKITRDKNLALADLADKVMRRNRAEAEDESRKLKGLVVVTRARMLSGLEDNAFGRKYADHRVDDKPQRRSYLERKWFSGEVALSRSKAALIDQDISGTSELYDHAVFPLLQNLPLSLEFVERCLEKYSKDTAPFIRAWRFPDDDIRLKDKTYLSVPYRDDSMRLVHRHDLHGFALVLGLVRQAEASGDRDAHVFHLVSLYRCLPAVLAIPWFKKHADLLRSCIEAIHARSPHSLFMLRVNWDWIEALATPALDRRFSPPAESENLWRLFESEQLDVVEVGEVRFSKFSISQRLESAMQKIGPKHHE